MKTIKNLSVLFLAMMFAIGVSAQGMASSGTKSSTGTKTSTSAKASTGTMKAANTDKVDASKKGPHGEVVYTGPKGGSYYMNKDGKKVYLKK